MKIREANPADIPEIVKVLKASLGEDDLPLSEEIWNYKHILNPFGESLVLLAEEDGKIIGIRAFMRWQWQCKNKIFSAFRAVDTATHPGHRGKGIFKKITLKAVEIAKEKKDNFVFNTPNEQSRPGYLKMGWEKAGKIGIALKPAFNSFWKVYNKNKTFSVFYDCGENEIEEICKSWNDKFKKDKVLFTPKTHEFLQWRYEQNPLQKYEVYATPNLYMAVSVKTRKGIRELRVVECIFTEGGENSKKIKELIRTWSSKFGAQVISFSPRLMDSSLTTVQGKFGPILTLRELEVNFVEKEIIWDFNNWSYSLGDLELF